MITHIYVDIDGVLADFYGRFGELFDDQVTQHTSNTQKKKAFRQNWNTFIQDRHFETLDPLPDIELGLAGLNILKQKISVEILGSTANPEVSDELIKQKVHWLEKHGIDFNPIFVPGKRLKQQYADHGKVLIDDTQSNIDEWNEQGGIGILHTDWMRTLKEIRSILKNS